MAEEVVGMGEEVGMEEGEEVLEVTVDRLRGMGTITDHKGATGTQTKCTLWEGRPRGMQKPWRLLMLGCLSVSCHRSAQRRRLGPTFLSLAP